MRRVLVACTLLCALFSSAFAVPSVSAQGVSCANYDAWEWAQSVFESDPKTYAALDPDGDGIACGELPHGGFAPVTWTDKIPADVEPAQIIRIIDGDTFEMLIGGVSNRVRIYRADTPETQNRKDCGGAEATSFATFALGFNDNADGTVYLQRDKNTKDIYGRELAYVWFTIDGKPYLLNELLIRAGWADDADFGDRMYADQFGEAKAFAEEHDLGVWAQCGRFGVPLANQPAPSDPSPSGGNSGGAMTEQPAPQEPVYTAPEEPAPAEPQPEEPAAGGGCNPNYSPCVPNVPYDLDCKDIGMRVTVVGYDQYGLDRDGDGIGCESY